MQYTLPRAPRAPLGPIGFIKTYPVLAAAIVASLGLHAAVLSLRFAFPDVLKSREAPPSLEVVLVNSKSASAPVKADVLAQANLDLGGNTDEDRRAKTPLPASRKVEVGDDVRRAQRRVQELEAKQRQLLAQAQAERAVPKPDPKPEPAPQAQPQPQLSGVDLRDSALMLARMEAQIARQIEEYNKRPRKTHIGARAKETRFAQYVEAWRQKIERIGNLNYPEGARGRIYGSLRMTVAIRADGSVESMQIDRSSGHRILDAAAEKIVRLAEPFAPFPPEIRRDTDILVITRTWTFAPGDRLYND
ncbi:MAG: energy transducer TonB [Pseudomonadota bacterium]